MTPVLARLRRRLSFANVVSTAALFVALGGTSYAAIALPPDSVGADQIRTGAVGTSEVSRGAVGRSEIRTGGVGSAELRTDSVRGWEIRANSVGSSELRDGAVGAANVAKDAVTADAIKDGSVGMAKLDDATRGALAGGGFREATVNSAGAAVGGNAKAVGKTGVCAYNVDFGADVTRCTAVATLGQAGSEAPAAGEITVAAGSADTAVVVRTFDSAGAAKDQPFHVLLDC
jgi:hypothetical protein